MSQPELRTRTELEQDAIRRIVTYTDQLRWFGPNSTGAALAKAMAGQAARGYALFRALVRRTSLLASSGDYTTALAEELGARRRGAQRAKVLAIVVPRHAVVTAITSGVTDLLEVDDSSPFEVGSSVRIRSADGATTESATVIGITTGSGPGGGDELQVAALTNAYAPTTEDVRVLLRHPIPAGTALTTSSGVTFETVSALTVGDFNPVLNGESTFLGLADKVWCECRTRGAAGNIEAQGLLDFSPRIPEVLRVYNPERAQGGGDTESTFDLKYRASTLGALASQETPAWVEATAKEGNADVLRAVPVPSLTVGTLTVQVLATNGGALTANAKAALASYLGDRTRAGLTVVLQDVTLTSVEIDARVTLDPNADLSTVYTEAASRIAAYLDFRKWSFGADVDAADLLSIVNTTPGVATLDVSSFQPQAAVSVSSNSLPTLTRFTLTNTASGDVLGADLLVQF